MWFSCLDCTQAAIGCFFDGGVQGATGAKRNAHPQQTPAATPVHEQASQRSALDKLATISSDVDEIERRRSVVENEINELGSIQTEDDTQKKAASLRKNCLFNIEELMRRLEALDGLDVSEENGTRAARKELVNRYSKTIKCLLMISH